MIRLNDSGDLVRADRFGADERKTVLATAAELKAALAEAGLAIVPVELLDRVLKKDEAGAGMGDTDYVALLRLLPKEAALKEADHD